MVKEDGKKSCICVGIPTSHMNYYAARQLNTQWCWAASIKMVLNYYEIGITQKEIVARTYGTDKFGNLPNLSVPYRMFHKNLNNRSIDNNGFAYTVKAKFGLGRPPAVLLINELAAKRPVIIVDKTGPNTGHAVVVTGVAFVFKNNIPTIVKIIVRDPWPSSKNIKRLGKVECKGLTLARRMGAYWFIRVRKEK